MFRWLMIIFVLSCWSMMNRAPILPMMSSLSIDVIFVVSDETVSMSYLLMIVMHNYSVWGLGTEVQAVFTRKMKNRVNHRSRISLWISVWDLSHPSRYRHQECQWIHIVVLNFKEKGVFSGTFHRIAVLEIVEKGGYFVNNLREIIK